MNKCCFIIPYFGKLPNYFPLFLKSCSYNPDYNWMVFTDDNTKYDYPSNVDCFHLTFGKLQEMVRAKFNFNVSLETPYKLCDFKPAYGYIFEEYTKEYRYWGHCDIDVVLGNLNVFLDPLLEQNYDKIFQLGHMTIYKNTFENNRIFMNRYKNRNLYKEVFSTPDICWFDESWKDEFNINSIFLSMGKNIYSKDLSLNVVVGKNQFYRTEFVGNISDSCSHGYKVEKYKDALYLWNKGNIERYYLNDKNLIKESYLYFHFQSRRMKMDLKCINASVIKILANNFELLEIELPTVLTSDMFNRIKRHRLNFHVLSLKINRWKKKIINIIQ